MLTKNEWLTRYKARFMERAGLDEAGAQCQAEAVSYEELVDGFEEDPEGAADEEMSNWAHDGDEE